jgi:hypothetical protein
MYAHSILISIMAVIPRRDTHICTFSKGLFHLIHCPMVLFVSHLAFQTPDLSSLDSMLDERMSKVEVWASEIESLSIEQQSIIEKQVHLSQGPGHVGSTHESCVLPTSSLGESDREEKGNGFATHADDYGDVEEHSGKYHPDDAGEMKSDTPNDQMSWMDSILGVDRTDLEPEDVNPLRRLHQERQRRKEEEEAEHLREKRVANDAKVLKADTIALEEARKGRERRQEEEAAVRVTMIEEMERAMETEVQRLEEEAREMGEEKVKAESERNDRELAEKKRKQELQRLENERIIATERRKRAEEFAFVELQRNSMRKEDAFAHSWREETLARTLEEEERKRKEKERKKLQKWQRECNAMTETTWDLLSDAIFHSGMSSYTHTHSILHLCSHVTLCMALMKYILG